MKRTAVSPSDLWNTAAETIRTGKAKVAVLGLGYVGLAVIEGLCQTGCPIVGLDINTELAESYRSGDLPPDLDVYLKKRSLLISNEFAGLKKCDVVLICVPTPLDRSKNPDLSFVYEASRHIAKYLRKGQLIILESTTYPGTTEEEVRPILEETGMQCGRDFFLAYCPERVDPGNPDFNVSNIPRVLGGVDEKSGQLAAAFYSRFVPSVAILSSARAAEAAKILENIYRCVNIALVNELKMLFDKMDIDIWEVIEGASTKPFGFHPFKPGPGLGGHCVPIDPFYLSWKARQFGTRTRFIELAGEVNATISEFVFSHIVSTLNSHGKSLRNARVLILGVAYKPGVPDTRESPAGPILSRLHTEGAKVSYNDPYVPDYHVPDCDGLSLRSHRLTERFLSQQDCVVIVTDHPEYDFEWIVKHSPVVVDTRNATEHVKVHRSKIVKA